MRKFLTVLLFILSFSFCLPFAARAEDREDAVFQVSVINALLEGVLEGGTNFKTLREKGDFGIGTFNDLDGEMIALDGNFYQLKSDGKAYAVSDSTKTPFGSVTFFTEDKLLYLDGATDYKELTRKLDGLLPTKNIIYAVRIDGEFKYVKTRSVPAQQKPYPRLTEVVKTQPVFEFHKVKGTLVGFYFPDYFEGINVPGYHFHFITRDKTAGGHVLEIKLGSVDVKVDEISDFRLLLPGTEDFYSKDFSKSDKMDLVKVEK